MNNIKLDLKIQDELRKLFSLRGSSNDLKITSVSLGDSDVEYNLSQQKEIIQSFASPFKINNIKHKLVYEGDVNNVSGSIYVNLINVYYNVYYYSLRSIYDYPSDYTNFTAGTQVPLVTTGYNFPSIPFSGTGTTIADEGYVVFLKTIIDNYSDEDSNSFRYNENYDLYWNEKLIQIDSDGFIDSSNLPTTFELSWPSSWEFIYDKDNNSFLITIPKNYSYRNVECVIKIVGKITGIEKELKIKK